MKYKLYKNIPKQIIPFGLSVLLGMQGFLEHSERNLSIGIVIGTISIISFTKQICHEHLKIK